jgi:AcrR family transcriptional regulator
MAGIGICGKVHHVATDATVRRKEMREALNRALILDAAEEAFAERGYEGASLRDIAARAGFSSAALYLFFENKDDLYAQTLLRRGSELVDVVAGIAQRKAPALQRLHEIADAAIAFYLKWPHFGRLVARGQATMYGSPLWSWAENPNAAVRDAYERSMQLEADVVREGQQLGEIRSGDPRSLAHLFSVLVNTFMAVRTTDDSRDGLTDAQMHEILDSVLDHP